MNKHIREKYSLLLEKEDQIRAKYQKQAQNYTIGQDTLKQMYREITVRQGELAKVCQYEPKEISKYFITYQPLSFNKVTFKSMEKFGGPKMAFNQGKVYIGTIVDSKRHGIGVLISPKGKIYQGEMMNNQRQGFGIEIYERGNFYVGNFQSNKREGKGLMIWANSSENNQQAYQYYNGYWKNGEPNDKGLHSSNGIIYLGSFKAGVKEGMAVQLTPSSIYQGPFFNGQKEGKGVFFETNNYLYQGEFKEGRKHGYGQWLSLTTFEEYEGFFQKDMKEGIGLLQKANQFYYRGMFTEDKPNGTGEYLNLLSNQKRRISQQTMKTELASSKRGLVALKKTQSQTVQRQRSAATTRQEIITRKSAEKGKKQFSLFNKRKSLSSAKIPSQVPESSCPQVKLQPRRCRYKGCSCHNWQVLSSTKTKIDEPKIKRIFSSRKLLVKQLVQ